jgi:hypothetical protein
MRDGAETPWEERVRANKDIEQMDSLMADKMRPSAAPSFGFGFTPK